MDLSLRQSRFASHTVNLRRLEDHATEQSYLDVQAIRVRVLLDWYVHTIQTGKPPWSKKSYALSTMCPTRRSIIDGIGSPASSAAGFFSAGLGSLAFFSFFCALPSFAAFSPAALSASLGFAAAAALPTLSPLAGLSAFAASGAGAAFSFFCFGGSALRSWCGAFSRSNATREKAGVSDSAALRTEGRFWT